MKKKDPAPPKQEGGTLVTVLIIMFVLSVTVAGILTMATQHFYTSQLKLNSEQAFYAAEGGLEVAAEYVMQNMDLLPNTYSASGTIGSGTFEYEITKSPTNAFECDIYCVGTYNDKQRAIELQGVRNSTYADFSFYATDNGSIYFKSGEEFFGKVHTGSTPYFSGDPIFHDVFTTEASSHAGNISDVTFHSGFLTDQDDVGDIAEVDFDEYKTFAWTYDEGLVLSGTTSIEFDDDDVLITNAEKGWNDQRVSLDDIGLIYVEDYSEYSGYNHTTYPGELYINGGTLDGRITLVSESDTYIYDHIEYAVDPLDDEAEGTPDDALGIVSGDDVIVSRYAPEDITIHATIMATGARSGTYDEGSFYVDNAANLSAKGNINLLGGIIQEDRGVVGYFNTSSGTLTHGYNKQYRFDTRFEDDPPPYYPALESTLTYDRWVEVPVVSDDE